MNSRSSVLPNRNKFELGHQTIDAPRERTSSIPFSPIGKRMDKHGATV